ncbi:MAG TPA: fumarylacetoacetase [Bacteroidia bacterium]
MPEKTNDPALRSWVESAQGSLFPIQNLPIGIFSTEQKTPRAGIAIGDYILDLAVCFDKGFIKIEGVSENIFAKDSINSYLELGRTVWRSVRSQISNFLNAENASNASYASEVLVLQADATMHLAMKIGDYTDFYSSLEHASNVGKIFRPNMEPLLPNWKHLPVGYHGRSNSIVISGTDFHRPNGQTMADGAEKPSFGPSKRMDIELEMAFVIGKSTKLGDCVKTQDAWEHVYGLALFNDWSARDLQKWEYVPLGPFLGKNFASSIAPWIVSIDALEPFRVDGPSQDPEVLPYLQFSGKQNFDIALDVYLTPKDGEASLISKSNHKYLYWNIPQQLAHHTVNGCPISAGDVYASGTISAPYPEGYGSMLELSWGGSKPIPISDGSTRTFLLDYDKITITGYCEGKDYKIGFGEVTGTVLPAKPY